MLRCSMILAAALLAACPAPASAPADAAAAHDLAVLPPDFLGVPCPDARPGNDTTCTDTGLWCRYPAAPSDDAWCLCHQGGDASRSKWQCWEETCPGSERPPPVWQAPSGACRPGEQCASRTWEAETTCFCVLPESVWHCCVLGRPDSCAKNTKSGDPCCTYGTRCGACTCEVPLPDAGNCLDGGVSGARWCCR